MKKILSTYTVLFFILFSLLICNCSKDNLEIIKVGYLPIVSDLSFFVAMENGYFDEFGVTIEPVKFAKSIQAIEALTTGRIQVTSIVGLSNLLAVEQNVQGTFKIYEMTYAGENTEIHKIIAKKGLGISSLSDLKGKIIGTLPGSQMKVFTKLVLDDYLDPETDVTIVPLSPPNQKDALASGRVQALFTLEPQGTQVTKLGIGDVISLNPLYNLVLKPFPTAASAVSTNFLRENPKAIKKYLQAIYKAIDFIESNPIESKKRMLKYVSLDEGIALKVGIYKYWKVGDINKQSVNKLCELYHKYDVLEKLVDTSEIYYSNK